MGTLNRGRVQTVMRYAVAVAAGADEFRLRELGPIHLIKYVYLADLAYASKHGGETFTGAPWRFYHFGPWATEIWQEIQPAMRAPGISSRSFKSQYQDDGLRWSSTAPHWEEDLERELPFEVNRAVKHAVRSFYNETPSLLHHVYRTAPMLQAAPEEQLDFRTVAQPEDQVELEGAARAVTVPLSKAAVKRRKAAHEQLRERFQRVLAQSTGVRADTPPKPPRYDEVFAHGQEWLDSLAGEPLEPVEGELIVSDEIWKSPTRSEPSIP